MRNTLKEKIVNNFSLILSAVVKSLALTIFLRKKIADFVLNISLFYFVIIISVLSFGPKLPLCISGQVERFIKQSKLDCKI